MVKKAYSKFDWMRWKIEAILRYENSPFAHLRNGGRKNFKILDFNFTEVVSLK